MLIGISPLLSPELLSTLYRMGHGDEMVLADAHFPGESVNDTVVRADGLRIPELLDAILPLFALDAHVDTPVFMMDAAPGDTDRQTLAGNTNHRTCGTVLFLRSGTPGFCCRDDRRNREVREYYIEKRGYARGVGRAGWKDGREEGEPGHY